MRVSLAVATTEFRRTVRAIASERSKLLVVAALAVIMLGSFVFAGGYLLPLLGEQFAGSVDAETATVTTTVVTGGVAVGWLFLVFMAAIRTFTSTATVDRSAFLLTSTSLRNVVVGVVGAEILLFGAWLVPPTVLLAGAFAAGAGTVLPIVVAPLAVLVVLVTAVPVGFVIGVAARHLVTVYEPIARYRTVLFVGFWALYFGALATGRFDLVVGRLFGALQDSPLGWPGHLLLVGVPNVPASSPAILGAAAGTVVVAGVATAAGIVLARVHWFADPARFDDEEASSGATDSSRLADLLSSSLSRPVRTVTMAAVRRTTRAPIRLAYVAYPLFGGIWFLQEIVRTGIVPSYVAVILSVYVVWAAGALFTLNPLGDLGRVLPAVMTSTLTGRQAVTGLVVAGAIVAVPVAVLVSLALGLASPLSLEESAVLVAATAVGAVVTPGLATGVGTAFPRFGSVNVTNNREAVMPSKIAFLVYSLAIVLPAVAAVVLYADAPDLIAEALVAVSAWTPGPAVSVSARGITVAAWTVLLAGLVAPAVSYLYAVERFDWYSLE